MPRAGERNCGARDKLPNHYSSQEEWNHLNHDQLCLLLIYQDIEHHHQTLFWGPLKQVIELATWYCFYKNADRFCNYLITIQLHCIFVEMLERFNYICKFNSYSKRLLNSSAWPHWWSLSILRIVRASSNICILPKLPIPWLQHANYLTPTCDLLDSNLWLTWL